MKIKILHILHSLQIGGLENGVVNLINHLDDSKFEHAICCIDSPGSMAERITRPVAIYTLSKGNKRDYLLAFKIARIIKKAKPDIVHTRNWAAIDGVIGAKLAGVKHVIHGEHGREATDPTGANSIRKKVRKALNPWVSKFITVSAELRNWLVNSVGIPESKVTQIINGVNTEVFHLPEDKGTPKKRSGFKSDDFVIGTVGRLDPVKDFQTLIKAFAKFVNFTNQANKTKLLIIGSGPEEQELKILAKDLRVFDRIRFLGEQRDIPKLMQVMDIFILTSIAEGISNTILEAMSTGIPVVATDVGGNQELIIDRKTGMVFSPGNVEQLSIIIANYYKDSNLIYEHGSASRKRVKDKYSVKKMASEYEAVYFKVTNTR